jgi:hypothetical protein
VLSDASDATRGVFCSSLALVLDLGFGQPSRFICPDTNPVFVLGPAQRLQISFSGLDFKFNGTKPSNWVWQKLALTDDRLKWLAVPAGRLERNFLKLDLCVPKLNPINLNAPTLSTFVNKPKRFLALFAGVLKANLGLCWQSVVGFKGSP